MKDCRCTAVAVTSCCLTAIAMLCAGGATRMTTEGRYRKLADALRRETIAAQGVSSQAVYHRNPKYAELVGMGEAIVPCVMRDLDTIEYDWLWFHVSLLEDIFPARDYHEFYGGNPKLKTQRDVVAAWQRWWRGDPSRTRRS